MSGDSISVLCFSPYWGGMEMDALRLWRKLRTRHAVHMIVRAGTPLHESLARQEGAASDWVAIPFKGSFSPRLIIRLRSYLKTHQIHAGVFFGASEMWSLYPALLGTDMRLIIRHGTTKSHPKKDPLHRLIYSRVYAHVAISDHLLRNVREIFPIPPETRVERIYPGISFPPAPTPAARQEHVVRILHVGRIAEGKGHADAICACEVLWKAGIPFQLTFVGDNNTEFANRIRADAASAPYGDNIHFAGHVTDVWSCLADHDIFLFPSHGEGLSNALIEALGTGLVCITYDNTVFPEFVSLGFHLHLVTDRSTAELGKTLQAVASNLPAEKEKALCNITAVREIFSVEQELAAYERLMVRRR